VGCWWLIVDDADNDEAASTAAFVAHDVGLVVPHDGRAVIVACGTAMCHWLLLAAIALSLLLLHRSVTLAAGRTTAATVPASFGGWELLVLLHSPLDVVRGRALFVRVPFNAASCCATRSPHTSSSVGCKMRD
jgi:hypothetical protein